MVDLTKNAKPLRVAIELLWGLPGSGKSEYANQTKAKLGRNCYIVDGDVARKENNRDYVIQHILSRIKKNLGGASHFILDGLFYDDAFVDSIFTSIKMGVFGTQDIEFSFEITAWNEDRESCVTNDKYRKATACRQQLADTTIENAPFTQPSPWLLEKYNVKVNRETVYQLEPYQKYFAGFGIYGKTLRSDSWSGGGTYGNCYDDHKHIVSAEPPRDFDDLDDLIEKMCGDISVFKYKKLRALAATDSNEHYDYYGGHTTSYYWEIKLEDLYDKAKELGVIE